jgi:hypothetical protein
VALVEKQWIGGESGHSSAHLTCVTDLRLTEIAKRFGRDAARLTRHAGATANDLGFASTRSGTTGTAAQRL